MHCWGDGFPYFNAQTAHTISTREMKNVCHAEIERPMGASGPEESKMGFKTHVAGTSSGARSVGRSEDVKCQRNLHRRCVSD